MFLNFKFKKWATWVGIGAILLIIIGFAESQQQRKRCKSIVVEIDKGQSEHFFITKSDVERLLNDSGQDPVMGKHFGQLDFRILEQRVLSNQLVKTCQVFRDVEGNLQVSLEQHRPVARISFAGSLNSLRDLYVGEDGSLFPMSEHYTARVMVLSGEYFEKRISLRKIQDQQLMEFVQFVDQNPLWKAQVTQADVDEHREIALIPQVGNQVIEFGTATDIEKKFDKIKVFYTTIQPAQGDKDYRRVNVKYRNQIVCE